jgi:ABC-2 type transport system permease protein
VIALIRTEFTKAAFRTRTLVVALLLIGLPTLIVVAINARSDRPGRGEGGDGLFRLASQSGLFVPAAVLSATSRLLLIIIAGTFAGDSVAGDASWGNLRYVLMRPI